MIDHTFISKLLDLDALGKDGLQEMRELLKQEGGISRLIGLAKRGVDRVARAESKKMRTRIPDEFPGEKEKQSAIAYWEAQRRPDLVAAIEEQCEEFVLHHTKCGSLMASWPAAWGTWIHRAPRYTQPPRGGELFSASVLFEQATLEGWVTRLEIFHGLKGQPAGTWLDKWGAKPGADGCRVPPEATESFRRLNPSQKLAVDRG